MTARRGGDVPFVSLSGKALECLVVQEGKTFYQAEHHIGNYRVDASVSLGDGESGEKPSLSDCFGMSGSGCIACCSIDPWACDGRAVTPLRTQPVSALQKIKDLLVSDNAAGGTWLNSSQIYQHKMTETGRGWLKGVTPWQDEEEGDENSEEEEAEREEEEKEE
jgi:hypothetical protein